jgi:hypothetical protein
MSSRHTHITPDASSDLARLLRGAEQRKRDDGILCQMVGGALWAIPFIVVGLLLWGLS